MILYSVPISPYSARVRIQIHHKQLPVKIADPPGGLRSQKFKTLSPNGKVPMLANGRFRLSESWAIMEFLESEYADSPMLPPGAVDLAKLRELVRFADLNLAYSMFPMFQAMRGPHHPDIAKSALEAMESQLQLLEGFMIAKANLNLPKFDLADAALLPIAWYARVLARHFGRPDCFSGLSATAQWWETSSAVPAGEKILGELETGLRAALPMLFPAAR